MKGKKRTGINIIVELYRRWGGAELSSRCSMKKLVSVLLILLVSGLSLYAETTLRWSWHTQDERIEFFRYQLNGEDDDNWTVVDSSVRAVVLPTSDNNTLYVQASYDGVNWSVSGFKTYVFEENETPAEESIAETAEFLPEAAEEVSLEKKHNSLRVGITPYSMAFYRFYNGYNTTSTRTKTNSVYGFAASLEFNMPLSSWLSIYPELGCDIIVKKDTIIPGARNVQYYKIGAGIDFIFDITDSSSIYAGLFGGAMAHINNKKASITPYFGARLGYDYSFSEHFSIGAAARVSFALFIGRSEHLMDSMTILVDPLGVTASYRF
jgi:hypothetical protein